MSFPDVSAEKLALVAKRLREQEHAFQYWISEPIAILGVACRFPGGVDSPEAFWTLLTDERDGISDVPRARWDVDAWFDPDPETAGKIASRRGGFIDGVDRFDAAFFGISPREAAAMDPQQRVLLEVAWEALERAGQNVPALGGSNTGVFVGVLGDDYAVLQNQHPAGLDVYSGTGTAHNILAGRVAYLFDFRGPAIAIDTACSSSLVATHAACQSLRLGECDIALAGGVNLILTPPATVGLSRMRMLAPDGRCKTFDARADGFVRSEGCGVVVLKRLADAIKAGDPIAAVIRGSAVNQDGRSAGLTAPNGLAQQAVLRQARLNAGVPAEAVGYIETHGSGTALGDPIEVEAIRSVYAQSGTMPCVLGAVKTNIGHAEAAAGVAGLIKAVMALEAEAIPGNLHLQEVNPNLSLAGSRLELARGLRPWPRGAERRYAGVSSFGWSGTNAHVIVEEAPARTACADDPRSCYLLPVSGRTSAAAQQMAARYSDALRPGNFAPICATAGARRAHHRFRKAAVGSTSDAMRAALASGDIREAHDGSPIVFVYPGQGGQWAGMGRELFAEEEVFRRVIRECSDAIHKEAGWELERLITQGAEWTDIDRVQPALFAISVALTALWRHWGIEPAAVIGHSMGELAAAYVAGALSLDDAVRVICRRSRLLMSLRGRGGMGVVELNADAVAAALAPYAGDVAIAAINSRRSTVVAGGPDSLDALGRQWAADGVYWRRVQVDIASHCPQVDALRADLERELRGLSPQIATLRMVSTVTRMDVRGHELDARYWVANLRERVRFMEVVERLVADGCRRYVEVGPHGVLLGAIEEALGGERGVAVGSLRRGAPERAALLHHLGALYESGSEIAWAAVNGAADPIALPAYAWQRERHWIAEPQAAPRPAAGPTSVAGERELYVCPLPVADGHAVMGGAVLAGADSIEAALRVMTDVHGDAVWEARDVDWSGFVEQGRSAQLVIDEDRFRVHSRGENEVEWRRHGGGTLAHGRVATSRLDIDDIRRRCRTRLGAAEFYDRLARRGLDYAGDYRRVQEAWLGDGECLARVATAKLDACLQPVSLTLGLADGELRVPVRVARAVLTPEFTGPVWAWARSLEGIGHVVIANSSGVAVGEVEGLHLVRLGADDDAWLWRLRWERADRAAEQPVAGHWLIVGGPWAPLLADRLMARGAVCEARSEHDAGEPRPGCRGVVWIAEHDGIAGAVRFVQRMSRGSRDAPRLWFVTRGTQSAGAGVETLIGAGLWGFGRTLTYEHPEYRCTLVDATTDVDEVAAEIAGHSDEDQVALRSDGRFVARLRPLADTDPAGAELHPAGTRSFRLEMDRPGVLDRLAWRATSRQPPLGERVEVEVAAAGLNFLDVLSGLGEYPGQDSGRTVFGREFSGRVIRIGDQAERWRVGDEVVGCAPGSLGTHVVAEARVLAAKPAGLSWVAAAGQPVAFVTAYYALVELARLRAGDRVLIHSAASGTGLAALEVAQQIGADIWATAGTDARRAYLRERGVTHVMDSRTARFADEIRRLTDGAGVDVVLNSLAGALMQASLDVVAPYGRVVELGKRDLWTRDWFRTAPFRKNLAYFAVDMAAMVAERGDRFGQLLALVMQHLAQGTWRPLPVESVTPAAVESAFHRLAAGRQTAKLVVSLADRADTRIARTQDITADGAYLISGGLGGVGLEIAQFLVERGARHLALVGRRGASEAAKAAVQRMRARGARVQVVAADAADRAQVDAVVAGLGAPLRGVVHAAAELDDATVERLSPASIDRVWRPKAAAAWTLHAATDGCELDFFVVMSSVAALLGSPGQSHYAAANAWADALVGFRRRHGLPALTIHWGPWSGIGLAAARDDRGARLAERGMESLPPALGVALFGRLLADGGEEAAVMRLNLRQWTQFYPRAVASSLLRAVARAAAPEGGDRGRLRRSFEESPPERRRALLEQCVGEQAARVLRLDPAKMSSSTPFAALGFDSLIAIEFRNRLESLFALKLSATIVWAHPTVPDLAEHLAAQMHLRLDSGGETPVADGAARVGLLSEEAAEAELIEKLRIS